MEYSYFQCIPRSIFNTASLTADYQALNSTGFANDIKILKIYNSGTTGIDISYDGINDHDYFPAGTTQILDLQTNHSCQSAYASGEKIGQKNQIIYGKGIAGSGNLYIIGYY